MMTVIEKKRKEKEKEKRHMARSDLAVCRTEMHILLIVCIDYVYRFSGQMQMEYGNEMEKRMGRCAMDGI